MKKILLNIVRLSVAHLDKVGDVVKKIIRYVQDGEVPDTHTQMYDADGVALYGSDAKFNVKKEQ